MSGDYDIGYKKTPPHTRFQKGFSGNSKGRPKATKNLKTDLSEELREKIMVTEGGVRRAVSKQRGVVKTLTAKAMQGDVKAIAQLVELVMRLMPPSQEDTAAEVLAPDDVKILQRFEAKVRHRAHPQGAKP